jgi:hypothetical protein
MLNYEGPPLYDSCLIAEYSYVWKGDLGANLNDYDFYSTNLHVDTIKRALHQILYAYLVTNLAR